MESVTPDEAEIHFKWNREDLRQAMMALAASVTALVGSIGCVVLVSMLIEGLWSSYASKPSAFEWGIACFGIFAIYVLVSWAVKQWRYSFH